MQQRAEKFCRSQLGDSMDRSMMINMIREKKHVPDLEQMDDTALKVVLCQVYGIDVEKERHVGQKMGQLMDNRAFENVFEFLPGAELLRLRRVSQTMKQRIDEYLVRKHWEYMSEPHVLIMGITHPFMTRTPPTISYDKLQRFTDMLRLFVTKKPQINSAVELSTYVDDSDQDVTYIVQLIDIACNLVAECYQYLVLDVNVFDIFKQTDYEQLIAVLPEIHEFLKTHDNPLLQPINPCTGHTNPKNIFLYHSSHMGFSIMPALADLVALSGKIPQKEYRMYFRDVKKGLRIFPPYCGPVDPYTNPDVNLFGRLENLIPSNIVETDLDTTMNEVILFIALCAIAIGRQQDQLRQQHH